MFLTVQRTKLLGVLAVSGLLGAAGTVAIGCGDDNNDNTPSGDGDGDAGRPDAGGGGGGDGDAGLDGGGGETLSCGEGDQAKTCESVAILNGLATLPPCCAEGQGDACGLEMTEVGALAGGLFKGCVQQNQPSTPAGKKTSTFCTAFWEEVDAPEGDGGVTTPNGFTLTVVGRAVSFEGCCRVNSQGNGECGFAADTVLGSPVNFGCLPLDSFGSTFTAEQLAAVKSQAACDKTTGEAPSSGGDGGTGGDGDGGSDASAL